MCIFFLASTCFRPSFPSFFCLGRVFFPLLQAEFEWDRGLQGWILSSFFYGYIVTQILGGRIALRYGGKIVYGTGMLISIVCTVLVPVGARISPYCLLALRVIEGLAMVSERCVCVGVGVNLCGCVGVTGYGDVGARISPYCLLALRVIQGLAVVSEMCV